MNSAASIWPDLSYPAWRDTAATLQLWTQIVGKVRLVLSPWINHGWHVPLYVTARGLTTSPIPVGNEVLDIEFDFLRHHLIARISRGEERKLPLEAQSVADFYRGVMDLLSAIGVAAAIGLLVTLLREWRVFVVLAVAFLPYFVFHLLFQQLDTVRYALPIVVPVAWLAARSFALVSTLRSHVSPGAGLRAIGAAYAVCRTRLRVRPIRMR